MVKIIEANGVNDAEFFSLMRSRDNETDKKVSEAVAKFGGVVTNTVDEIIELDAKARSFVYGKA